MANYNSGTRMFYTRPDGQTYCFSPVPLLAESKEYVRVPNDSSTLAVITTLTFDGILLPEIPALSGVDPGATCLELLDRKSDQLAYALAEDRGSLVVVDSSGYTVINAKPRVVSLDFEQSQIVNHRKYQIVFEIESDFGTNRIRDYQESWSFQYSEDDTVAVNHSISAVGIHDAVAGISALSSARSYVLARANTIDKGHGPFHKNPYVAALVDITNFSAYNHGRSENSSVGEGSYEITENWTLASGAYKDDRTIERSWELGDSNVLVETINVNGTVQGYGDTTFDRLSNAENGFDTFVAPQIGFYDTTGITSKTLTKNRFAGTVAYSLTKLPGAADAEHIESRSIQRSLERQEDGSVSQSVTTSATLRRGSPSGVSALTDWVFANNYPIDSAEPHFTASLSGNIESVSVQRDEVSKSLSLTRVYRDQTTQNWREEWEVSREQNAESSLVSVSINGTVVGLGQENGTKSEVRFAHASGAYFNVIYPQLRARALPIIPTGYCIGQQSTSSTLGVNRLAGIITYSETWTSRFRTSNANVRDEQISVTWTNPADVVAEIPIPGKSDGPVLQDIETVTGLQKNLRIQYTMAPSGDVCSQTTAISNLLLGEALRESNILINNTPSQHARGEKPESSTRVFKTEDQYTWDRQTMVFQRNVAWKYK
jgi:hypothetical protein